jgi:hypothetical protein
MSTGPVVWLRHDGAMPPAWLLASVMSEQRFSVKLLAAACARQGRARDDAERMITEVLQREELTVAHAELLARAQHITGIAADFWLTVEHDYRMALAARLPDVTS